MVEHILGTDETVVRFHLGAPNSRNELMNKFYFFTMVDLIGFIKDLMMKLNEIGKNNEISRNN